MGDVVGDFVGDVLTLVMVEKIGNISLLVVVKALFGESILFEGIGFLYRSVRFMFILFVAGDVMRQ